jgi:hypothetical protein
MIDEKISKFFSSIVEVRKRNGRLTTTSFFRKKKDVPKHDNNQEKNRIRTNITIIRIS